MLTKRHLFVLVVCLMVGALALPVVPALGAALQTNTPGPEGDPLSEPIPQLDPIGTQKSFLMVVDFQGRSVTSTAVYVVSGMAAGDEGGPPLLALRARDEGGVMLDQAQHWHPLWGESHDGGPGEQSAFIAEQGRGVWALDFDPDIATIDVVDMGLDDGVVATIDAAVAVDDFCESSPSDPDCRIVDLWLTTGVEVSAPLIAVGETIDVVVSLDLANQSAFDAGATISSTLATSPGLLGSPSGTTSKVATTAGNTSGIVERYTLSCLAPGIQTAVLRSEATLDRPADVDPDPTNNVTESSITIDCATVVSIDIQPNQINLRQRGVVPITILSDPATPFDASHVDPSTVRAGARQIVTNGAGASPRDDGNLIARGNLGHLRLHVTPLEAMGLETSSTEVCIVGSYSPDDGASSYRFIGCESVRVR